MITMLLLMLLPFISRVSSQVDARSLMTCSDREAQLQAQQAVALDNGLSTTASDSTFLWRIPAHISAHSLVGIDVGASKGYHSAMMFSALMPGTLPALTPAGLHEWHSDSHDSLLLPNLCGNCNQCKKTVNATQGPPRQTMHVLAFEPSDKMYPQIAAARRFFLHYKDSWDGARWDVRQTAVTSKVGKVHFPSSCSTEMCTIDTTNTSSLFVDAITIDRLVAEQHLSRIHHLKVSTNGHEPAVLFGAFDALRRHLIMTLEFEYSGQGLWATTHTLQSVIKYLEGLQYSCYWPETTQSQVYYKITGCWHTLYETKSKSHVVCVYNKHPLLQVLDNMSYISTLRNGKTGQA